MPVDVNNIENDKILPDTFCVDKIYEDFIDDTKILVENIMIWNEEVYKVSNVNQSAIYNMNWDIQVSNFDHVKSQKWVEYWSRYYEVNWNIYYTANKKINIDWFYQIYDLKNQKWNINTMHIIFDKKRTKILYKWDKWDIFIEKKWNSAIVKSSDWRKYQVDLNNWKKEEIIEKNNTSIIYKLKKQFKIKKVA